MPNKNKIGEKIKTLMEVRNVSLEELANDSDVNIELVEKILNGEIIPSLTPLTKIARVLGVRIGTFIDDDEQTTIDWFNEIKDKLNIDCNYDEYKNAYYEYGKKIPYHKDVIKFAHSLRDKCYIAMFSSLVKLDEARINEQVNLSSFDYIFLTYKMGFSKPNSKAFEYIENTVKINPENILFIDDTQINIDEANKRKWKTCRADGFEFEKIKRSVEEFLEKGEINE